MSIRVKQQICLNLSKVRCLASYPSGKYALRFHIFQQANNYQKVAVPVSVIEMIPSPKPQYEVTDSCYTTKPFLMKFNGQVPINELCIFKNDINLFKYQPDYNQVILSLICQLIQIDPHRQKIVGVFQGKIKGASINDSLVIDFHQTGACQVLGSVHSCAYQFIYCSINQKIPTFQDYCERQSKQYVESLLEYLMEECKRIELNITNYLTVLSELRVDLAASILPASRQPESQNGQQMHRSRPPPCPDHQQEVSMVVMSQVNQYPVEPVQPQDIGIRGTEATEADEANSQKFKNVKKKRRRIFLPKEENTFCNKVTIEEFQKLLHVSAMSIYQKWRKVIHLLMEPQGAVMLDVYQEEYKQRLNKLIGESVIRFKGSWDIDFYASEEALRNKMAFQIRTQTKENQISANQFSFYNQSYYSGNNPILFEQTDPRANPNLPLLEESDGKHMIILVHGLGACRLDMQKLKVQLKRYYPGKLHIIASSSNEARTQGDIDSMGMRLANQVAHQIAKVDFEPKITFIGHSMGGVIIRSALPRLQKYSKYFHSLVTLSSPHVGYNYSNSKLIDAGLWVINSWKKCQSILQLTMADSEKVEETFLYQLSSKKGLEWFKKVTFISSHQDLYVPYHSARVQKHEECVVDERNKVQKALIYNSMVDNILNEIKGELRRVDVNFYIPQQQIDGYFRNLDNLIGRAAHINFVNNLQMVRVLCLNAQSIIF